jgi:CRP/FNR family cyclic AMP-dependent transcriptional regulator
MASSDPSPASTGVAALGRVPFLAELHRDELEAIADVGETVSFQADQAIVQKGDPGDAMYVILDGDARVDVGGRYHDLKPGDFFGEMAVIAGRRRVATVTAVGPVAALKIPADGFQTFLLEHPKIALGMLRSLVDRLREVQQRVDSWMGVW